MTVRTLGPEPSASTNSATRALYIVCNISKIRVLVKYDKFKRLCSPVEKTLARLRNPFECFFYSEHNKCIY